MTTKEIKHQICGDGFIQHHPVKTPAQPEQEPVELVKQFSLLLWDYQEIERAFEKVTGGKWVRKSNTPQRTWIDLTDEQMWNAYTGGSDIINLDYAKSIVALFKEKNSA